jgi:hypothetical protein
MRSLEEVARHSAKISCTSRQFSILLLSSIASTTGLCVHAIVLSFLWKLMELLIREESVIVVWGVVGLFFFVFVSGLQDGKNIK